MECRVLFDAADIATAQSVLKLRDDPVDFEIGSQERVSHETCHVA
jgi:hypothetical protein